MSIDSVTDLEGLKKIGRIVADCLCLMARSIRPGISTLELDTIAAKYLENQKAKSAPILTYNFPGTTCISVNQVAAHGIPSSKIFLAPGDVVNIDVSAELGGYFADTGGTYLVQGKSRPDLQRLIAVTRESTEQAISMVRDGVSFRRIGKFFEDAAKKEGFSTIKNLCSHGVGLALHEEPTYIRSHDDASETRLFQKNTVITLEPFFSTGTQSVNEGEDGWSLLNEKGHFSAQFEHTFLITSGDPVIVTLPSNGVSAFSGV